MPRSFLVKKKASAVPGMPRIGMDCREGLPSPVLDDTSVNTRLILIQPTIFSPAKLCAQSPRDDASSTCSMSPSRCHPGSRSPSRGSSHGSVTPEPINYSLPSPHTPLPSPVSSSPVSSPSLSPEPSHQYWPAVSPDMHLPYLALSFKRLQEMHIKAVESRLHGISMATPPTPTSPTPYHPTSPVVSPVPRLPLSPKMSPVGETRSDISLSPVLSRSSSHHHHHQHHHHQHNTSPHRAVPHHSPSFPWNQERYPVPMEMESQMQQQQQQQQQQQPQIEAPRKRREGDPPRYQCEACNKSYATFSGLSKHKQFHCTALIKKEYSCKHCDKKYVSQGALKMHIRTHTLPCKCHLCGKAFSRPWLLQGHMRTHTGEKPFQCSHCGRSFADRSNLRAHLQTHTDIKKYNCHVCSKSFSRNSLLQKHQEGGCGNAPALSHRSL